MSDFFSFARYETTGGKKDAEATDTFYGPLRFALFIPDAATLLRFHGNPLVRSSNGEASPREKVDCARLRESVFRLASKRLGKGRNVDGLIERRTRTSEPVRRRSAKIADRRLTRSVVRMFNSSTIEIRRVRRNGPRVGEKANRRLAKGERKRRATLHPFSLHLRFEY